MIKIGVILVTIGANMITIGVNVIMIGATEEQKATVVNSIGVKDDKNVLGRDTGETAGSWVQKSQG